MRYMPTANRPRTQGTAERAGKILTRTHRAFGHLKSWLVGTHQVVGDDHLQAHLDEFRFVQPTRSLIGLDTCARADQPIGSQRQEDIARARPGYPLASPWATAISRHPAEWGSGTSTAAVPPHPTVA
jgi:hypothetical protein